MRPIVMFPAVLVAALVAGLLAPPARAQVPAIVAGPRPAARVIDETGSLAPAERNEIERLARSIRDTTGADLMVVVIPTTAGAPHRRFATELFNRWQLGSAEKNDGLLLFVALADRRSEIVLGDGLDSPPRRAASQAIMDTVMVPHFRAGRPGRAVYDGATRCVTDILGVSAERPASDDLSPVPAASADSLVEKRAEPILEPLLEGDAPASAAPFPDSVDGVPPGPIQTYRDFDPFSRERPSDPFLGFMLLLGGGGATVAGGTYALRHLYRYRRRPCPHCGTAMILLTEGADDARLERSEKAEESVGSVDYDVWTCPVCPGVEKIRWGSFFTRFAKCPRCRAVTKFQTISRLRSPTQYREGLERIDERCVHCGWETTSQRAIPRLPEPTSSSIDWSSGSSSSGGFSGSGSGGHSSGGGASGSW